MSQKPPSEAQRSSITLPPPELTLAVVPEEMFPMLHRDWKRIRNRVAQLANRIPNILVAAWTSFGIAITCLIAWLPWNASYSQLNRDGQIRFAWVSPSMLIGAGAAMVIAVILFTINRRLGNLTQAGVTQCLEDMDAVYEPYRKS